MRQTKIVATISDKRCDVDFIKSLHDAGMNVARLNTAHITAETCTLLVNNIRAVSEDIAILIDTKGPEIRTCATQNEINGKQGKTLIENGCMAVAEGANMPTVQEGVDIYLDAGILYAPSKAANAGGVAVSGLEMTQNSMRMSWSRDELDRRLHTIMQEIHDKCVRYGEEGGKINYRKGANIAGFIRVADALVACGNL